MKTTKARRNNRPHWVANKNTNMTMVVNCFEHALESRCIGQLPCTASFIIHPSISKIPKSGSAFGARSCSVGIGSCCAGGRFPEPSCPPQDIRVASHVRATSLSAYICWQPQATTHIISGLANIFNLNFRNSGYGTTLDLRIACIDAKC